MKIDIGNDLGQMTDDKLSIVVPVENGKGDDRGYSFGKVTIFRNNDKLTIFVAGEKRYLGLVRVVKSETCHHPLNHKTFRKRKPRPATGTGKEDEKI